MLVEVFWTAALVVYETFQPIRLAEIVGGEERAGALMGPVAAVGWGVFAAGSALAGLASSRIGIARTAILARVLNGLGAVVMGLVAGPVALIAAYLFTYGLHGTAVPMHDSLLHREASAGNRATVLSMSSMAFFVSFSVAGPPLGLLADSTTTQVAMVTAGAFSVLGAFFISRRCEPSASALTCLRTIRSAIRLAGDVCRCPLALILRRDLPGAGSHTSEHGVLPELRSVSSCRRVDAHAPRRTQRDEEQWRALLGGAGFEPTRIEADLIEGRCR